MVAYGHVRGAKGKPAIQAVVARVTSSGVHVRAMLIRKHTRAKHVYLTIHEYLDKPTRVRVKWPGYPEGFHYARAGEKEEVLERA